LKKAIHEIIACFEISLPTMQFAINGIRARVCTFAAVSFPTPASLFLKARLSIFYAPVEYQEDPLDCS